MTMDMKKVENVKMMTEKAGFMEAYVNQTLYLSKEGQELLGIKITTKSA